MSVSNEKAIISIEVELKSNVKQSESTPEPSSGMESPGDIEDYIDKVNEESVEDAVNKIINESGGGSDNMQKMTDLMQQVNMKGVGNLSNFAKNPAGFMSGMMGRVMALTPPTLLAMVIIETIMAFPEIVKQIVSMFAVKGAPLNKDYRFSQEEQLDLEWNRHEQFRKLTGDNPVITLDTKGFVAGDPDFDGNSLINANLARTARIGLSMSENGPVNGI